MFGSRDIRTSPPPYLKSRDTTRGLMTDVLIALTPALILSVFTFGPRAALLCAVSVVSCMAFAWLWELAINRKMTLPDLSAAVTGLLLAFLMPAAAPLWLPVVGAAFAILVVRSLFGGLGQNRFNPALSAWAFLMLCFPEAMRCFTMPRQTLPLLSTPVVTAVQTPLEGAGTGLIWLLLGQRAGGLGETAVIALLAGAGYLLWRRGISLRIPAGMLAVVAAAALITPDGGMSAAEYLPAALMGGSLLLIAFFMATDPVTTPVLPDAQWLFGLGCGLLTVLVRKTGAGPEGAAYAVLMMNALSGLLDRLMSRRFFRPIRIRQFVRPNGEKPAPSEEKTQPTGETADDAQTAQQPDDDVQQKSEEPDGQEPAADDAPAQEDAQAELQKGGVS